MFTLWLLLVIVALVTVFSVQNAAPVAVAFLFWKFEASLAVLVYLLVLLGIAIGTIVSSWFRFRAAMKKPPPAAVTNAEGDKVIK